MKKKTAIVFFGASCNIGCVHYSNRRYDILPAKIFPMFTYIYLHNYIHICSIFVSIFGHEFIQLAK